MICARLIVAKKMAVALMIYEQVFNTYWLNYSYKQTNYDHAELFSN